MKTAIAYAGGGAKGAFQAGATEVLAEKGVDPTIFTGTSVGAINASFLAQTAPGQENFKKAAKELSKMWMGVMGNGDVYDESFWGPLALVWRHYLYDPQPLRRLLRKHLDPALLKTSGRELFLEAVEFCSGRVEGLVPGQSTEEWVNMVMASASITFFFPDVDQLSPGEHWYDGGFRNITPLKRAIKAGAERVFVVVNSPVNENPEFWKWSDSKVALAMRMLDILLHEVFVNDLKQATSRNSSKARNKYGGAYRTVDIQVIQPPKSTGVGTLDFTPAQTKMLYAMGRDAAKGVKV